jgi:hypothetical protein
VSGEAVEINREVVATAIGDLIAERDRYRAALQDVADNIGPDDFCGCEDCEKVRPAREKAIQRAWKALES